MNNSNQIRVRFAPSPTGHLHIGGLRTALFNWLFARHHGGAFLLRIEDTDLERSRTEYTDSILEAFRWAGIESDEPLVIQTQRTELYKKYLQQLLDTGSAYRSDPATEENGKSVIRFRVPREQQVIAFEDLIHGRIEFPTDQIDDFVIARADDSPLYNFVVVVDDMEMRISHIIRADEHIPNTPRQLLLYQALGATPPQFAHVSLILGPEGKPLSKRDASTSVLEYRSEGFLPQALCNYLVRLGWSHGDQELFTPSELIKAFTLAGINKSGAMFDYKKLLWVNGEYLRKTDAPDLVRTIVQSVEPTFAAYCNNWSETQLVEIVQLYRERVATLKELATVVMRLHATPTYTSLPEGFAWTAQTVALLQEFVLRSTMLEDRTAAGVKKIFDTICAEQKVALPALAKPVRFALTGCMESPSVFSLVACVGIEESSSRVQALQRYIEENLTKGSV